MARKEALTIESKFTRGLITETTPLNFPQDACTETYDCVFNHKGYITRRLGIDLESGYTENTITLVAGEAYSTFIWDSIKSYSDGSFVVQQQGRYINFFDIADNITPSANINATVIDLNSYKLKDAAADPSTVRCQYAQGSGYLLIVNQYTNPLYVEYDLSGNSFTVTPMVLRARDFVGLDDGFELTLRSGINYATLLSTYPEHLYNLKNQGWYATALTEWDSARTDMPSNADAVGYFRVSATSLLTSLSVEYNQPGNSPAPKGHYILEVGGDDRYAALVSEGIFGTSIPTGSDVSYATGSIIGNATSNQSNAFDNNSGQAAASCATRNNTEMYIGKTYSPGYRIGHVTVWPSTDAGFMSAAGNIVIELWAKNGVPSTSTDGILLGSYFGADGTSSIQISNENTATIYTNWWVRIYESAGTSTNLYIGEIKFTEALSASEGPTTVAFFAGRAWYAGIREADLGARIYFSQIIDSPDKFNLCYQTNDPASDKYADLLATDGGVIHIPDINEINALFNFQSQLLILASNGVWLISGGTGGVFAATDYRVKKISSIGCASPQSVVDVKGLPIWWGEDGIYTVVYDANYDSTVLKSLTEDTIKTFVLDIDSEARQYVMGTYDRLNDIVYWMYSTISPYDVYEHNKFVNCLCLNIKTGAFYPWLFPRSTTVQSIRGVVYIQDGERTLGGKICFPVTYTRSSVGRLTFAECYKTTYKDWAVYAGLTGVSADELDYSSYFMTGYRLDGQAMTNFQANYILSYLSKETNASIFLQGLYEFTYSGSSGKWSTAQQAYNSRTTLGRTYHDTRVSRLVVRGSGKALRLHYYSETGKPFTAQGWGLYISGNDKL